MSRLLRKIAFSLSQRRFWRKVRRKREEWKQIAKSKSFVVVPVSEKSKIKLSTSSELSSHIYCGAFEWEEREWLEAELKSTDVFYDIGANIGLFTILAAERCRQVIGFEPSKETFDLLQDNLVLNHFPKNIEAFNAAASDQDGDEDIYVLTNGKDAWNSMAVKPEEGQYRVEQIAAVNVDAMVTSGKIPPPSLVKIDVEGWELKVLKGMHTSITKYHPTLLIEFTASNLKAAGTSSIELAKYIHSLNYDLFEYDPRYRELNPVSAFDFEHKNLIAKPKR